MPPTHGQGDMSRVSCREFKVSSWETQHQLDDKAFENKSGQVDRESGHGFTGGPVHEEYLGGSMTLCSA